MKEKGIPLTLFSPIEIKSRREVRKMEDDEMKGMGSVKGKLENRFYCF